MIYAQRKSEERLRGGERILFGERMEAGLLKDSCVRCMAEVFGVSPDGGGL